MPKRMTATEKWAKKWFRRLTAHQKLAWYYLCDNCDYCGIWEGDTEMCSMISGIPMDFDWTAFVEATAGRVVRFGADKFFVTGFCAFQYPNGISNPKCTITKNIGPRLLKLGLLDLALSAYKPENHEQVEGFPNPLATVPEGSLNL